MARQELEKGLEEARGRVAGALLGMLRRAAVIQRLVAAVIAIDEQDALDRDALSGRRRAEGGWKSAR